MSTTAVLLVAVAGTWLQPLSASFTAFAGEKVSFFEAATLIVAPVEGLRASRSGMSFTLNFPNPARFVLSTARRRISDRL